MTRRKGVERREVINAVAYSNKQGWLEFPAYRKIWHKLYSFAMTPLWNWATLLATGRDLVCLCAQMLEWCTSLAWHCSSKGLVSLHANSFISGLE
eukprot:1157546-Pelagomonas_calceolata.AAC.2